MKRFLCTLLVLCLVPLCVYAGELDEFNKYAVMFGVDAIDESIGEDTGNNMIMFKTGTISIGKEPASLAVFGTGEPFFMYCMAAICSLEGQDHFTGNCGMLLSSYILCKNGEDQTRVTYGGHGFSMSTFNDIYLFVVMK